MCGVNCICSNVGVVGCDVVTDDGWMIFVMDFIPLATFRGGKRYEIVPYSGVYTMPYSNQSSRRTVFISYRIQMIFMAISCRRKANLVFVHTVFIKSRAVN